ncbi:MAG TPA: hypothetical protein DEQ43_00710 [Nocardioides bacterium]|jgi:hypothetical protein|nr:hypothetical protein [Nocardioides sp.]
MPRILVTGSRSWTDRKTLSWALTQTCIDHGWMVEPDEYGNTVPRGDVVVVHGGAQGADTMADDWAAGSIVRTEIHFADWRRHGRRAGPMRNRAMVEAGADVCLAFLLPCSRPDCERSAAHWSHGASHCASLAEKAGIPVRRVEG